MEYSFIIISGKSFVDRALKIFVHLAKLVDFKVKAQKIMVDDTQPLFLVNFTKDEPSDGPDLGSPDVVIITKNFGKQVERILNKMKSTAYVIMNKEIFGSEESEMIKNFLLRFNDERVLVTPDDEDFILSGVLLVISKLFPLKRGSIIKVLKSLKEEDTTRLLETFKSVIRNERIKRS